MGFNIFLLFVFIVWSSFQSPAMAAQAKTESINKSEKQKSVKGKIEKNILLLKNKLRKDSNNKLLNYKLGKLYNRQKQPDQAILYLKKSLDYEKPYTYLELATSYRLKKAYLDEIRILNLLIPKVENFPKPIYLLGKALFKIEKLDEAITKYRKAIDINPKFEAPYWGMLEIYNQKKNYYESRIILHDMIRSFGEKSNYYDELCRLYSVDSFFENSIKYCKQAIVLNSKKADNHIYLGQTYKFMKEKKSAERTLLRAAKSFKNSEFAQESAGLFMEEAENYEKAAKFFQRCIKINRKNSKCLIGLGRSAFILGNYQKANQAYYRACILDRKIVVAEYKKQAALLRMDKNKQWYNKFTNSIRKCYNP